MPTLFRILSLLFITLFLHISNAQVSHPDIAYNAYVSGFDDAVDIANAADGTNRLFVVERAGRIKIIENDALLSGNFLNIVSRVGDNYNERGLLGLAFHPDYKNNGYFYVNYTNNGYDTRISRFSVDLINNPNQADANSEQILLTINQPYWNHNGGCIRFGPDGYLYIGMGDGGSGGDPDNYSQNRQSLLGKMLRIDVDGGSPYAIPSDNPFVNDPNTRDEIWAVGVRNPWRFSFDALTGDLWIADVGQNAREEIDFQPVSSSGGENYGWRCYEGDNNYNTSGCSGSSNYVFPIYEYDHSSSGGPSITGGIVYRGSEYSCLQGFYFFADAYSNNFWTLAPDGNGGWDTKRHTNISPQPSFIVGYGEDEAGELYAVGYYGTIYKVESQNDDVLSIPNVIPSNLYPSNHVIVSDGTVPAGNVVDFEAVDYILLDAGFCVEPGADFDAIITPCVPPEQ